MDLKDWTGTTTFFTRSMLTLGTVAMTLSLAKEVSLAVAVVESDVETVAMMVGLRPISMFLSSSPSLCLYPTIVSPRSPSRPIAAVETQICSSLNLPFSLPLPLRACLCHSHGSGSSQPFRVCIELVILSLASEFNGDGGGEDEVGQEHTNGCKKADFFWGQEKRSYKFKG